MVPNNKAVTVLRYAGLSRSTYYYHISIEGKLKAKSEKVGRPIVGRSLTKENIKVCDEEVKEYIKAGFYTLTVPYPQCISPICLCRFIVINVKYAPIPICIMVDAVKYIEFISINFSTCCFEAK